MTDKIKGQSRLKTLWTLFWATFYISACTFGGGFVIVTFMKRKFVDELHWIDEKEMMDFTVIAQSSPGAIAVNAAILVGQRTAGWAGMAVAVIGTILPPIIILTIISFFYVAFAANEYVGLLLKGMQAGVAAVIADVSCNLFVTVKKEGSCFHFIIMAAVFVAAFFFQVNVVLIILGTAALGLAKALICNRKKGRSK